MMDAARSTSKTLGKSKLAGSGLNALPLQSFQAHVDDMRNLLLCKICIRPLYEPYTLGCGHTYCYSCLTQWFGGASERRRKNCPDCRADVTAQPSPNYLLRDMVHMFISRAELLPEDETIAEHDEAKLIEARLVEHDRNPGLFKGAFSPTHLNSLVPVRDVEDGVFRCPVCTWEMEDGECGQCGYIQDLDFSGDEDLDGETIDSRSSISMESAVMGHLDGEASEDDGFDPVRDGMTWSSGRDHETFHAQHRPRESGRANPGQHVSTSGGDETDSTITVHAFDYQYQDHGDSDVNGGEDEHAASIQGTSCNESAWSTDAAETVDEDEDMAGGGNEEDGDSTTSFHRSAILARDQGFNPSFNSDVSTDSSQEGDGEASSDSSDGSTETEGDGEVAEQSFGVRHLATRPARVILDSEDDESSSDSSSQEDDDEEIDNESNDHDNDKDEEESSDSDASPLPPRPAAARQARLQMQRGRRPAQVRGRGRGRARGRSRGR